MLTRDLLRFRIADGQIAPLLLRETPMITTLCERLLAWWRDGVARRRGELEDGAMLILHQSRALVIGRGLQKLLLEHCRFRDPAPLEELRGRALALSAMGLQDPPATVEEHRAAVAAQLGVAADALREQLYGDLPDAAVLEEAPGFGARRLIELYNLALCQGLLLGASELVVTVHDADAGLRRQLLKALRFRRLLARVLTDEGGDLRLAISGPLSVLDQAARYGLQLALLLPALACARRWRAEAVIMLPRRAGAPAESARLVLDDGLGLVGDSAFLGFVPAELRDLGAALARKYPAWQLAEPRLLLLPGGELVVSDLEIACAGVTVQIELFHRWHGSALVRRLGQLAQGLAPQLAIGVERALARTPAVAALVAGPVFARHGFLFSDLPVARVLHEVVARWMPGGAAPAPGGVVVAPEVAP
jgi:predicted nuclease of restriction endonuclease-like RecB superfamily